MAGERTERSRTRQRNTKNKLSAIGPLIGRTKAGHRMGRCWLQGAVGDALHALCSAAGDNIRWLLGAITRLGLRGLFFALSAVVVCVVGLLVALQLSPKVARVTTRTSPLRSPAVTSQPFAAAI